uniref:Aldehyde dehydrogenase domain-containing protein n=1 Tax=Bionectria ochroleuca TaxID=29856 RepID=A0A8H7MZT4_BIOOC
MSESYHQTAIASLRDGNLFIKDAFIEGKWTAKDATFDVYEPSTSTVLGRVANCNREDIQKAVKSAAKAQPTYFRNTTGKSRGALLRKWHDLIMANAEDIGTILSLENGKTISEAKGEVVYAASFIAWFAEEATRSYGVTIPSSTPDTTLLTVREPVGVCGIITPWNFPAAMITRKLAVEAGFAPELIQVCPTKDREAATELATNLLVKKISFTGSTGVGKMLARLASGTLKKVSLELGGNAPFIVFDDADLDLAVEGAMFCKFRCSGQTCVCANRIYVQRNVAKEFTAKLIEKVSALKMGPGLDDSSTQGPLVNKAAVKKVQEHVDDAVSKGAKVELGGSARQDSDGYFFQPTILSGVTREMAVARDETFGPLAPIFEFDTEDDAVTLANDTEFGLAGYFFSRDVSRAMRVAHKLQVGMVGVNTGKISAAEAPFGGVKESGYGKEGSLYGLEEYQVTKSITFGNLNVGP